MAGLTRNLAQFVATFSAERLPAQAIETAKRGFIDCLGVMIGGRDEEVVRILLAQSRCGPDGEAHVLFDRGFATTAEAALFNATAAHALDYDDTGLDGHPSVALVPALLAEGERLGAAGADLIAGYVAGYETWAELVSRDEDKHHGKGWHPTAVFGTLAAAAAAALLARLAPEQTASALGIAASMAAGLVANFGSMVKALQVGRAAQGGVLAARLAAGGLTASADALEHRAGFLQAFSPRGRVRVDGEIAAGRDWHILRYGLNVKRYPVCYAMHRSIDAALELAERHDLRPEQVTGVELRIGPHQAGMLRHSSPENALDAKFSAEFAMAAALTARRVGLAELSDSFVRSAGVRALMPKVRVSISEEPNPEEPLFARHDEVSIRLADGTVLESGPVRYAKGHARNPLELAELRAKFSDCVGEALAQARRDALFERLSRLETLADTAVLYALD